MAKRILFVEDDTIEREAYQHQLEKAGFAISVAGSGPKAIELLEKEKIDLVVLDIMIPGFDGFHVLEKMKEIPKSSETPVIVLTNLDEDKFLRRALKTGATEYLIKANTLPAQVVSHIKKLLSN